MTNACLTGLTDVGGVRQSLSRRGGRALPHSGGRDRDVMSALAAFRYDGKRALVVGGATGMGAAAAQTVSALGGEVVVMDHAPVEFPVAEAIKVDLRDRAAIDAALDQVSGSVDAVFSA